MSPAAEISADNLANVMREVRIARAIPVIVAAQYGLTTHSMASQIADALDRAGMLADTAARDSAHVEVWRDAFGSLWQWTCTITACSGYLSGDDDAPTHAEALQAALDHCARYPIKDRL